jgi:hypothetical protein
MANARETQLEQRIELLEDTVAQLIRATSAALACLGGNTGFGAGGGWGTWQRLGARHEVLASLNACLQRHPAPGKD